ncbi:lipoprotein insertase outer membrane protein LolB [Conservatibacter flavescens]|uniref:Outer-membrane lipoprotein LolB n=1 Tax=Conservatibacter flavescens TaxID=28161 RepID=A0A2M8S3Y8_9PAST|nr:lipoprotein insertase outer membrane protein LolB [Conservatibacter flavescens]PJG85861.1 lipoprotein localization factor LolB [Conservatibacter flavescens]
MLKLRGLLSVIIISVFISACTTNLERPTDVSYIEKTDLTWQQHLQQLKQIRSYASNGQLGYISPSERFSTRFEWHYKNPRAYTLRLSSTISSASLLIEMHEQGMTISDHKGRQRSERDAQMLLREVIGMDFPLNQFTYWLKGQPDENEDYKVGTNHLLATFSYPIEGQIWTADYLSYHEERQPALPKDILLKNQNQTLKIRVDSWTY